MLLLLPIEFRQKEAEFSKNFISARKKMPDLKIIVKIFTG